MAARKASAETIVLPELNLKTFTLKIVGDTPLLCHAWSQKAKQMILNKQTGKAKVGNEIRRPFQDFADSLYWLTPKPDINNLSDEQAEKVLADIIPQSKFGFPASAFKKAALLAGFQQGALVRNAGSADLAKTTARGAIRILNEFAVINGLPTMREDMVRVGGATKITTPCYRAEFKSWSTDLTVQYNATVISLEQIANLFRLGGFSNGVGDWRPERDGNFGTFHIE